MNILTQLANSESSEFVTSYSRSSNVDSVDVSAMMAIFAGFFMFFIIIFIAIYVINAYFLGRIFKKAGIESWIAWVPIYNNWKMLEIGGQQGYWAVISFVPIVNIASAVFMIIAMFKIGKSLGKEDWFVLLAIFIPFLWLIWLAIDDSKWNGIAPQKPVNS